MVDLSIARGGSGSPPSMEHTYRSISNPTHSIRLYFGTGTRNFVGIDPDDLYTSGNYDTTERVGTLLSWQLGPRGSSNHHFVRVDDRNPFWCDSLCSMVVPVPFYLREDRLAGVFPW